MIVTHNLRQDDTHGFFSSVAVVAEKKMKKHTFSLSYEQLL